jgi:transcriptional regulator with XRE-family HTH domain
MNEIGVVISRILRESGMRQCEFAHKLNTSAKHLSRVKNGRALASDPLLVAICDAAHLPDSEIVRLSACRERIRVSRNLPRVKGRNKK